MKTVLVAGASRGIGLAVARELGVNDYHIAVMATRDEAFYPEGIKTLLEAGISYAWYAGDIGKSEDRSRIVRETTERFGEIHVLVSNIRVAPKVRADLLEMTEESFNYVIRTNTKGSMLMAQAAARQTTKQPVYKDKRGTIINTSPCSSQISSVNRGEYCVSKAGISMLTKLLAGRLAPEGILVYKIRPGVIRTDMINQVEEKYTELIRQGILPIVGWGVPEDATKTIRAFCSDGFCYTTGNYTDMDGGFHIQHL